MTGCAFTPAARRDLAAIWDFTAGRWGADQAERYLRLIHAACEDLAHGRRLGQPAEHLRQGYRRSPIGAHVIFYRAGPSGAVEVIRILHRRMDVARHL